MSINLTPSDLLQASGELSGIRGVRVEVPDIGSYDSVGPSGIEFLTFLRGKSGLVIDLEFSSRDASISSASRGEVSGTFLIIAGVSAIPMITRTSSRRAGQSYSRAI